MAPAQPLAQRNKLPRERRMTKIWAALLLGAAMLPSAAAAQQTANINPADNRYGKQ